MFDARSGRARETRGFVLRAVFAFALTSAIASAQNSLAREVHDACQVERVPAPIEVGLVVQVTSTEAGVAIANRHVRLGVAERGAYGDAAAPNWVRDAWTDAAGSATFAAPPEGRVLAYVVSSGEALVVADTSRHPLEPPAFGGAPLPWTPLEVRAPDSGPARARLHIARGTIASGTVRRAGGLPWAGAPETVAWIAAPGSLQVCTLDAAGSFAWRDPRPAPDPEWKDDPAAPSPPLLERVHAGTRPLSSVADELAPGHVHGVPTPVQGAALRLEVDLQAKPRRRTGSEAEPESPTTRPLELPRAEAGAPPLRERLEWLAAARRMLLVSMESQSESLAGGSLGLDAAQTDALRDLRHQLREQLFQVADEPATRAHADLRGATDRRREALRTSLPDASQHRFGIEPEGVRRALADLDSDDPAARARARRALQRWIDAIAPFEPDYAAALAARHDDLERPRRLRRERESPRALDAAAAFEMADEVAASLLADLTREQATQEAWAVPLVAYAYLDPAALERFVEEAHAIDRRAGATLAVVAAAALVIEARAQTLEAPERWRHLDLWGLDLGVPERLARDPRRRDWKERLTR